jgi:predicted SAM-dependent methyltransferase
MSGKVEEVWEENFDDPNGKGLRIGCGEHAAENWVNLDSRDVDGVDIVHDIRKVSWPIHNSSYDAIMARDVLEHIPHMFSWVWEPKKATALSRYQHALQTTELEDGKILAIHQVDPMVSIVEEMYRISKPGAVWLLQFPVAGEIFQHRDPTHARGIHPEMFLHWCKDDVLYNSSFDTRGVSIIDFCYGRSYRKSENWNMVVEVGK